MQKHNSCLLGIKNFAKLYSLISREGILHKGKHHNSQRYICAILVLVALCCIGIW